MIATVRKYALSIALFLVAASLALLAYTVISTQDQRAAAILRNCVDQNERHDRTIRELDYVLARAEHLNPARRREIATSRVATVLLIDALAPHQNCEWVLAKATK